MGDYHKGSFTIMATGDTEAEQRAICDILKYIQKHPNVKHSAEGVAKYWILQQRLEESLETALAALNFLTTNGFLERIESKQTSEIFKVNKKKLDEIPRMLKKLGKQK